MPAYSLIGEPLGDAGRRAIELARAAGALISLDLASAAPLLAKGRRAARRLVDDAAPDILLSTAAEAEAYLGGYDPTGLLERRRSRSSSGAPPGRHSRPRRGRAAPFRGRDAAPDGDRHDRRRRRIRRRVPDGVPGHSAGRSPATSRAPACRARRSPRRSAPAVDPATRIATGLESPVGRVGGCTGRRPAERAPAHAPHRAEAGRPPGTGPAGLRPPRDPDVVDLDLDQAVAPAIDRREVDADRLAGPRVHGGGDPSATRRRRRPACRSCVMTGCAVAVRGLDAGHQWIDRRTSSSLRAHRRRFARPPLVSLTALVWRAWGAASHLEIHHG